MDPPHSNAVVKRQSQVSWGLIQLQFDQDICL